MNKSTGVKHRLLLRSIAVFYGLLFLSGLISSAYFLADIVRLKPIPMIGLLKYSLLCILFLILLLHAIRALSLKIRYLNLLAGSTKNFKWLFTIAVIICLMAKVGLFDLAKDHPIAISYIQLGILTAIGAFCFWSDKLLKEEEVLTEEETVN